MRATEEEIETAAGIVAAAGVSDVERYREQLAYWAQWWPAAYLDNIARDLVPVARKWGAAG